MKIFALLFSSLFALADNPPPPAFSCGPSCSEPMRQIVAEYDLAGMPDLGKLPTLFSGDCYHLSREYQPDHAHHGFTLLETKNDAFFMGGLFSFYAKENPYREFTIEQARNETPRRFDELHRLFFGADFAFADMNPQNPKVPWKYWLRQRGETLLLLSQWGPSHRVFCRFTQNR